MDTTGPAFPIPPQRDPLSQYEMLHHGADGMSLRDYFAAAMVKCLSLDVVDRLVNPSGDVPLLDEVDDRNKYVVPEAEVARRLVRAAYLLADAMVEERAK